MRIAVVSDTHGHVGYTEQAVALIRPQAVEAVLHCGDIGSPEQARRVLAETGADAIMIGRAAQGRPWIFGEIAHYLAHGSVPPPPATRAPRPCRPCVRPGRRGPLRPPASWAR